MPYFWDFFSATKKFIKKNQPVSYTGALIHPYYWLMSKTEDYICNNPSYNPSSQQKTLVYVVPGTADFPLSLFKLVNRLRKKKNLDHIVSFTIASFSNRFRGKSIDEFVEELLNKIIADKAETIVLIGHSRGGLVAAKVALRAAQLGIKIKAVITLGTPFNGSYLAIPPLTWLSASVKQMKINSKYLKELSTLIVKSEIPHHFMIAGDDEIVRSGAFIKEYVERHPGSMKVFPRHGHLSLPTSGDLITDIVNIIKDNTPEKISSLTLDVDGYESLFCLDDNEPSNDLSDESLEIVINDGVSEKLLEIAIDEVEPTLIDDSFYEDLICLNSDENPEEVLEMTVQEQSYRCY
ncbi:lipase/acyltransferase domain-containing protein [Legionella gresilensis]|uniref:PGAP1-like alpha/beta domain-containing protein n=1 Tax=Legionella gresilensis TaxID=91823 RepID=UPI001041B0A1|nr:alpha/beta hydrolase [Legionella gresilensis]